MSNERGNYAGDNLPEAFGIALLIGAASLVGKGVLRLGEKAAAARRKREDFPRARATKKSHP